MALTKVPIPIPFAGGVDTLTDPKAVTPARLLDLQNGVFTRATSIAKRNGYRALSQAIEASAELVDTGVALGVRDDELVQFTPDRCYSYRPEADRWSDVGDVASAIASDVPLARTGSSQTAVDAATLSGVTVVAWEDSRGGIWWATVEAASGRLLRPAAQLDANGQRPRCVAVGTSLHVYYAVPSASRVWVAVINPATPTVTAVPTILISDLSSTNPTYDAEPTTYDSGNPALIAWVQPGGVGGGYRVGYVHASGVLGSPVTGLPTVVTFTTDSIQGPIAVAYGPAGSNLLAVMYARNVEAKYRLHNTADLALDEGNGQLTTYVTAGLRITGAFHAADTPARLWWAVEIDGGAGDETHTVASGAVSTSGVEVAAATQRGHGLASRAFADGDHVYATLVHPVTFFAYYATVRLSSSFGPGTTLCVARILPGLASGLPAREHLPSVTPDEDDARIHRTPLLYHEQFEGSEGDVFGEIGIRYITLDFDHAAAFQSAQLGRGLYLAGACPLHYDGDRWAEMGFHCAPDGTITLTPGAGGSLSVSSTYLYRFVYEEIDAQGEIHQGPTSAGSSVTTGGAQNRVTCTIPTYRLTGKRRVRIGVFRTEANDASAFYRVSSLDPSAVGSNGYVLSSVTADTVSFVDDMSDATLLTQEPLYANGGIASNDPPPWSGACIAGGKNRLFWTDPSDPNVVRFSQEHAIGYGVESAARLSLRVDPYGGAIVGVAVLDDAVIVLKESALYVFGGPGPLANPDVGTDRFAFTTPTPIPSDGGCSSVDSIAYTPQGLVYQSAKGIRLLDRSRQVIPIGMPVEGYAAQRVSRATGLPGRSQILFLTDAGEGRALLYDHEHGQWSTFTNHLGVDAAVVGGDYYYLRTDGRVFLETPGVYRDDNRQIPMLFETAWIKLGGYLQGWQRIYHAHFLGAYLSPHVLRVRWQLDYEAGWGAPKDLTVDDDHAPSLYGAGAYGAGPYGGEQPTNSTRYQRRIHIGKRCQAIRFQIGDVEDADDFGASFELSELLLTGGMLAPAYKISGARSG